MRWWSRHHANPLPSYGARSLEELVVGHFQADACHLRRTDRVHVGLPPVVQRCVFPQELHALLRRRKVLVGNVSR
eukprot:COSAG03_NODE_1286_length_4401_cov_10.372617_3_plen_75_part_00